MSDENPSEPAALDLRLDAAQAELLDSILQLDQVMASMAGLRAQMVDRAHDIMGAVVASRSDARGGRHDREFARDLLVSELAALLRVTPGAAAHLVAESRMLVADLPATLEALSAGRISYRHATTVIDNSYSLPEQARGDYEAAALPHAERLNTARFRDRARRLRERMHPESIAARRTRQMDERNVGIEPGRDGMVWLSAYLPAELGLAIDDRLDRIAASMRSPEDGRTFRQLRADAFCELLVRGVLPADAGEARRAVSSTAFALTSSSPSRCSASSASTTSPPPSTGTGRSRSSSRASWRRERRVSPGCSPTPKPGSCSPSAVIAMPCPPTCATSSGCATRPAGRWAAGGVPPPATSTTGGRGATVGSPLPTTSPTCAAAITPASTDSAGA
ncbi:MAG: DUF222 domain-containing protein [Schumannella sp.]